jgi:hypothetical protein
MNFDKTIKTRPKKPHQKPLIIISGGFFFVENRKFEGGILLRGRARGGQWEF